jgi:glycosyltransferase involved in cell wall biosynthesis
LAKLGTSVAVFTTNANGAANLDFDGSSGVMIDGVPVRYFKRSSMMPSRFFYAPALGNACAASVKDFDLVYICGTWTYEMIAASKPALRAGIPYVISPRGSFMRWAMEQRPVRKRAYLRFVERKYIDKAAFIHCTSEEEVRQTKILGFDTPIELVPNGIDLHAFQSLPMSGRLRYALKIPPTGTVSLFVGRLHKMKRLDVVIRAFSRVSAGVPDSHLLIVGADEGGMKAELQTLVRELGLTANIHILGLLTGVDLMQAYADSDLLVLVSHRENFGMVVVEAMAAGLPVLVSQEVGLSSDIEDNRAGVVVDVATSQLEDAWRALLLSGEKRATMGRAGRELARTKFSSEAVAKQMLALFESVLSTSSRRRN